jgi:hypothetical protein
MIAADSMDGLPNAIMNTMKNDTSHTTANIKRPATASFRWIGKYSPAW